MMYAYYQNTYHRDGSITYWSRTQGKLIRRARDIPSYELEMMAPHEQKRVLKHLGKLRVIKLKG
jgi:hypothetical protein